MNIDERRNERRRKILENAEARLSKITALKTAKIDLNTHDDLIETKLGDKLLVNDSLLYSY